MKLVRLSKHLVLLWCIICPEIRPYGCVDHSVVLHFNYSVLLRGKPNVPTVKNPKNFEVLKRHQPISLLKTMHQGQIPPQFVPDWPMGGKANAEGVEGETPSPAAKRPPGFAKSSIVRPGERRHV